MSYRRVNNVPLLIDESDELKGTQDFNDGEERMFVFDGEPTRSLAFDTDNPGPIDVGVLRWNDSDGTLEVMLKGGNVTLQIGQEQNARFRNNTNAAIQDSQVVYITGSTGTHPTIALAQADSESTSTVVIGVATEDIAKNAEGFVTTFGLVRNINTSALTEGAAIWLSPTTAGSMTTTKPTAPQHLVLVGYCIRSHVNFGVIFVKPQNGYELEELHNVKITNPTDGQVLKYQASTGLWINANP